MPHAAQISPDEPRIRCAYCYRLADGCCASCDRPRCQRHDPTCATCEQGCCVGCVRTVAIAGEETQMCGRCRERQEVEVSPRAMRAARERLNADLVRAVRRIG